jgi:hypothetical protein
LKNGVKYQMFSLAIKENKMENPMRPVNGIIAYYHGWNIEYIDEKWRYSDTKEPIPGWGGESRPCKKCGAAIKEGEPDKCLGYLPGVDNACCGHGNKELSYIRFTNGLTVSGFVKTRCADDE